MKKIIMMLTMTVITCSAIYAQDSTRLNKNKTYPKQDTFPTNRTDTAWKNKHNNQNMPKDKRKKNLPDSLGRPDSLKRQ